MARKPTARAGGGRDTDVLIVGAGLVGGVLAAALSKAGIASLAVDAQDPAVGLDAGFDGRASAIALASARVLDGVGLWPRLADRVAPILEIRVSDGDSPLHMHYDHREVGGEPLGYMLENRFLRVAQNALFAEMPEAELSAPNRVVSLDRGPGRVTARLADGREVRAALAVAADGRGSQIRDQAGIRLTGWSYGQDAIVCSVEHEKPHDFVAHEHFLPPGPFAILPLTGTAERPARRSSIVWTEKAELAERMMALDEAEFMAELGRRFGDFLGRLELVGPRWRYPLSLQYAETSIAERLALIGDADHGMHPIAGQGLNMGIRDVAALAEILADAKRLGQDIGSIAVLERYRKWRRFDNTMMLAATDGLNRLFSNDIPPIRLARDLGLAAVDRIPPLKRLFMRHAMGLLGDLPRLTKGEAL